MGRVAGLDRPALRRCQRLFQDALQPRLKRDRLAQLSAESGAGERASRPGACGARCHAGAPFWLDLRFYWGCKPEPRKIPSSQLQPRHERVQVDRLAAVLEGVVPVHPPEDCGGPWGYADMLRVLAGHRNARRRELVEWLGRPFDPKAFDMDEAGKRLTEYVEVSIPKTQPVV